MKLVRPFDVTDAVLLSSNVTETETQWSAAVTYAAADIVRGTGDNQHKLYLSLAGSNLNNVVTDTTKWQEIGASNRWEMFDSSPQSQTSYADVISVTLGITGLVDTLALQNVDAETARVVVTDAVEGVVYDQTFSMVSDSGITDWWAYFFEPIERVADLTVSDLPPYADATINVSLTDTGATVGCGVCLPGLSRSLGGTQWGGSVGIQDYSVKSTDDYGVATIVQRAYAKRGSFTCWVTSGQVDQVASLLAQYRATAILLIADDGYESSAIYGFIKDFNVEISYEDVSLCSIEFEGLA
jgi:hypothetical protein